MVVYHVIINSNHCKLLMCNWKKQMKLNPSYLFVVMQNLLMEKVLEKQGFETEKTQIYYI
jgi:hypothetical protein